MKRFGNPDDIERAILFLAPDAASWITGHVLPVEGRALLTAMSAAEDSAGFPEPCRSPSSLRATQKG
jgi:hypothetical protein